MNFLRQASRLASKQPSQIQAMYLGSSAGKGGAGSSGAIREAGGAFKKKETAHEEEYFYKMQREQLEKLKEDLHDEIHFHEEQIKRHQEAINRHKQRVGKIDKK